MTFRVEQRKRASTVLAWSRPNEDESMQSNRLRTALIDMIDDSNRIKGDVQSTTRRTTNVSLASQLPVFEIHENEYR
jgi:hypothetical protein